VSQAVGLERLPATIGGLIERRSDVSPLPGHSLAPLWATGDPNRPVEPEPILSEVSAVSGGPPGYPTSSGSLTSLVTGDWHLIVSSSGATELYAWPGDREERVNLGTSPAGRVVVDELRRVMQRMSAVRTP
jgi:hypothetical protein